MDKPIIAGSVMYFDGHYYMKWSNTSEPTCKNCDMCQIYDNLDSGHDGCPDLFKCGVMNEIWVNMDRFLPEDYNEVRKQVILRALELRSDILIPTLNIAELEN